MPSPRFSNVVPEHPSVEAACTGHSEQDVFFNLLRSYDCLWTETGKFIQSFGITPQQYNVLNVLSLRDGGHGIACQEIAENLMNRVPDITRLLDRLEQAGFIWRERCCSDRRVVRTHLTDAGREKVETIRGPLHAAMAQRVGHLSQSELSELNRLLRKLREPSCEVAKAAFTCGESAELVGE